MAALSLLLLLVCCCSTPASAAAHMRRKPVSVGVHASGSDLGASPPLVWDMGSRTGAGAPAWSLSGQGPSGAVSGPASAVPGNVYADLLAQGVLQGDPLYRDNEAKMQWVASGDWTYTATFDLPQAGLALQYGFVDLEADGLDTVALLELNGHYLGRTDNMHVQHVFPVKQFLRASNNTLQVTLLSPLKEGAARAEAYPYPVPRSDQMGSLPNGNFLRKAASDFGWDWGPAFAASGIWLPMRLVAFQQARLVQTAVHQYHSNEMSERHRAALKLQQGDVLLRVSAYARVGDNNAAVQTKLCVNLALQAGAQSNCTVVTLSPFARDLLGHVYSEVWLTVPASSVQLWWPVGYGAQPLSTLTTILTDASGSASSLARRVGLRTVELVRETGPEGQNGTSFYYRVNSVPVFAKGANLIPLSSFHGTESADDVRRVMQAMLHANGNIVRVWGGGVYQLDALYDYADEVGLLVWQELSFACAMYPRDAAFLSNVRREVAWQVRRLASHASILVFGGNNENEVALTWYPETIANRDHYLVDYVKLYLDTVRDQVLQELQTDVPFVTSSPSRGPESEEPYTQLWGSAQSADFGDMHYYNYDADCSDIATLPRARFVSEFGFQSLPSLHTLAPVLDASQGDYGWNSSMMFYRQRHPQGNEQLRAQMALHFQLPDAADPTQQFADWIYLTQAVQAVCYRTALSFWRRIKQETPGRTMGTIYWQLNDLWQAPTWSSLEYGGRWKSLHYEVARAFAPLIVTGSVDNTTGVPTVRVYATSDVNDALNGKVQLSVNSWAGAGTSSTDTLVVSLQPLESTMVLEASLASILAGAKCANAAACYIALGGTFTVLSTGSQIPAPRSEILPAKLRDVQLARPKLSLGHFVAGSADPSHPGFLTSASFSVETDVPAAVVWLDTALEGRFSDNAFGVLDAGENRTVTFHAAEFPQTSFTLAQLQQSLTVRSLRDSYSGAEQSRPHQHGANARLHHDAAELALA